MGRRGAGLGEFLFALCFVVVAVAVVVRFFIIHSFFFFIAVGFVIARFLILAVVARTRMN